MASALIMLNSCGSSQFYDKVDQDFGAKGVSSITVSDTISLSSDGIDKVKFHGRYYYDEKLNSTWFDFSNSGFEVTFTGTSLEGAFYATNAGDDTNRPYMAVFIDNNYDSSKEIPIKLTTSGTGKNGDKYNSSYSYHPRVLLADGLENTKHTVRVYKRSESNVSHIGLKSLSTDGSFNDLEAKKLDYKMEVFGDSVSCGYGVDSSDYYQKFCSQTEDATKSFTNVCANLLNSDISTIACGGYPIYKSKYSASCLPGAIPDMFSYSSVQWYTTDIKTWDNSKYIPDFVVIALGANDCSIYNELDSSNKEEFVVKYKQAYSSFINLIFDTYPDTNVIVSEEIIPINEDIAKANKEVVSQYNLTNTHKVLTYFSTDAAEKATDQTRPGEGHPNKEMQSLAGKDLFNHITGLLAD